MEKAWHVCIHDTWGMHMCLVTKNPNGHINKGFLQCLFVDINLEVRKGIGLWRLIGKDFDGVDFILFFKIFNIDTLFNSYM